MKKKSEGDFFMRINCIKSSFGEESFTHLQFYSSRSLINLAAVSFLFIKLPYLSNGIEFLENTACGK
jgi:hypothetical protein